MPPKCFKCDIDASVGEVAIWNKDHFLWVRDSMSQWQDSTQTWTQLPHAIWSGPDRIIEACNVYCASCWKNWAQFVKPGGKYELSKSCEEFAVRVGIQFEPWNQGCSNPFYCPQCGSHWNHGTASLEYHLRHSHSFLPLAGKRKHRHEFEEPILFVSGCSHGVVSSLIKGKYTAKWWHHGKPVYEKEKVDEFEQMPCLIYFWEDLLDLNLSGWWLAPHVGDDHVWGHNATNLDPDCLTVPKAGWKVPFDGEVDTALKITTSETHQLNHTNQTSQPSNKVQKIQKSDFELRWEFLAANEVHEKWQLMSKEMNDALEKRWAEGWDRDNGKDDFVYVQSNGKTYVIDCYCMVQWNLKAGRVRRIRRGESRPSPTAVQAQMAEKDAQMAEKETQMAEKEAQMAEKEAQMAEKEAQIAEKEAQMKQVQLERQSVLDENAALKSTVARLEKEKATLEASKADHGTQMKLQEAWRMNRQLETKVGAELNHWDAAFDIIRQALIQACPQNHFGICNRMRHVNITGLQQVCNIGIWETYKFRRDQVRKDLEGRKGVPTVVSNLLSCVCSWAQLDAKINEILVIHGTTEEKTKGIANFGFDERMASERGLYGQGVYFTDQSCKSLQYSGAGHYCNSGCFIIARLILGHPHEAMGPLKQLKVEPLVDKANPSLGRCHSVIAKPGTPTFGPPQVHRELVIFNGAQAYPEMIVHFRIS